ncbi:MAG: hypothetical protein ACFFFH_12465 [Candidatus Thorarchaeota archaeon]
MPEKSVFQDLYTSIQKFFSHIHLALPKLCTKRKMDVIREQRIEADISFLSLTEDEINKEFIHIIDHNI